MQRSGVVFSLGCVGVVVALGGCHLAVVGGSSPTEDAGISGGSSGSTVNAPDASTGSVSDGGGPPPQPPSAGNDAGSVGVPGPIGACGGQTQLLKFTPRTPDVLISFDMSGSMSKPFGASTRLATEQNILVPLVNKFQDRLRWGYAEFPKNTATGACPGGASCCAGEVSVPIAANNGGPVVDAVLLKGVKSQSRLQTPTADALAIALKYYQGLTDGILERYVLLSTDGEPNACVGSSTSACDDAEAKTAALSAAGVKTFVVGVSTEVSSSECLNRLAAAGGTARMGAQKFYSGSDPAALEASLSQIVMGLAKPSCVMDLTVAPPDPALVAVFLDSKELARDTTHATGWDYTGPRQITVFGEQCKLIQAGTNVALSIRFGCPPTVVK